MKPIRVAHITTIDFGLRHLLFNQLIFLKEAGFEVTGISSPGPDVAFLERHGIRHIAIPMTRRVTPARDLVSLARLVAVLKKEKFDIVHTHNPKPGLLGQIAARIAGIPYVVNTLHGFYFHENMSKAKHSLHLLLEKLAARCSDIILSQNLEDVGTAIREGICPEDRIKHLGNGIDLTYFNRERVDPSAVRALRQEFMIPEGVLVVGFVGRLVREKGIPELLEAARRAKRDSVRFLFVGPNDAHKKDAVGPDIARAFEVEELCTFTGMRYDMAEIYALMDLLVLPSHREGFPRVPMEAAAMGVPVIATDIRGCREAVVDGVNGILVPPRSSAHLAEAVLSLLHDSSRRIRLAENGRRIARERFDELLVFETVSSQYERLVGRQRSNGRAAGASTMNNPSVPSANPSAGPS